MKHPIIVSWTIVVFHVIVAAQFDSTLEILQVGILFYVVYLVLISLK